MHINAYATERIPGFIPSSWLSEYAHWDDIICV